MASATTFPSKGALNPHSITMANSPPMTATDQHGTPSVQYWVSLVRESLNAAKTATAADATGNSVLIDENIMNAPRRKHSHDTMANTIADEVYPHLTGSMAAIIQYEKDITMLRSLVTQQRRNAISEATASNEGSNWIKRVSKQGPWDEVSDPVPLTGANSQPMPVEQSDKDSLAPFFAHLRDGGTHEPVATSLGVAGHEPYYDTELLEFEKGVLYSDGRVDLCKMVTGPRNIGDLMESLKSNSFSKHFLLGNNIIGPVGAKAITAFINEFPERFETWYLAGNCIDGASFKLLVDAMVKSPVVTNVWMKRNPLGRDAAQDVFRLITQSTALRTLDLDQTELGDGGVAELFRLLCDHDPTKSPPLQHIYLNACGIGEQACKQISRFLELPSCTIQSLYISNNPMGSAAAHLAAGLAKNTSLQRLSLQSCGLKDDGIIALASSLHGNQTLRMFDIGQAYATEDLGMRFNWFTDASTQALVKLVETSKLEYVYISYMPMSQAALNSISAAISDSASVLYFFAKPLVSGGKDWASVKAGQEAARLRTTVRDQLHANVKAKYGVDYTEFESSYKRFLTSPEDVRFIDSVYRNRASGLARRGLAVLDKWWDDGDDTLQRVQDGTLV